MSLTIAIFAFARDVFGPPGKPGIPLAITIQADRCILEYTVPCYDGGAPIISYIIECRDKFSPMWRKVGEVMVGKPHMGLVCVIHNMREGDTAEFRVRAKNKAGMGEPSDASDPITFKD